MSYAVTPTLSVEAFHFSDTLEEVLPVEVRPVGAEGAWVSEPPPPPPGPSRLMSSA